MSVTRPRVTLLSTAPRTLASVLDWRDIGDGLVHCIDGSDE